MSRYLGHYKYALKKHKKTLQSVYHIEWLAIFGSVARSQNNQSSDIDILAHFSYVPSFFEIAHIENFLKKVLRVKKVDLIIENSAEQSFLEKINQDLVYI